MSATAWKSGMYPAAVALYTVQGSAILEYRFPVSAASGMSGVTPTVSVVVPPGKGTFANYTGLAATSAFDINEDSLDIFVVGTVNGVTGVHQYWQSWLGAGQPWSYGGAIAQGGMYWVSATTYVKGSGEASSSSAV